MRFLIQHQESTSKDRNRDYADPQNFVAEFRQPMGRGRHSGGLLDEAEAVYKAILETTPDDPGTLHLMGILKFQCGDLVEAAQIFERACFADPTAGKFLGNLATVYIALERTEEAYQTYERAIALEPDNADLHAGFGALQRGSGRADDALASYRRAIELDPAYAQAHGNLAVLLLELQRNDEALASARAAVAADNEDPDQHNVLAAAHDANGHRDEVEASLRAALNLDPRHGEALTNLTRLLRKSGREVEAATLEGRIEVSGA